MSNRILEHFRFGPAFARINRTLRSRRKAINKIMALYKNYGLVSNGCSLCESKNFTLVSQGDRYGFDLKKQFCNECGLIQTYPAVSKSTVSARDNYRGGAYFILKRLLHQLRLALRQLFILTKSQRRYISIRNSDFNV